MLVKGPLGALLDTLVTFRDRQVASLSPAGGMRTSAKRVAERHLLARRRTADVPIMEADAFVTTMKRELIGLLQRHKEEETLSDRSNFGVGYSRPLKVYIAADYVRHADEVLAALQREVESRGWQIIEKYTYEYEKSKYHPHEGRKVFMETMPVEGEDVGTPDVLYHITDRKRAPEILAAGLRPHKARAWLPDRVYLFKDVGGVEDGLHLNWMRHTMSGRAETLTETMDVVVLEIDPSKIGTPLKLHDDPEWSGTAVYTASPIPGNAISISARHFRSP